MHFVAFVLWSAQHDGQMSSSDDNESHRRSLGIAHVSFVKDGSVWVLRNIMGHSHENGKSPKQVKHKGIPFPSWELNLSHQGPEVTSLRVISKANPTKAEVVFPQADTSYQSSEGNSQKESSERNSWTWSLTFRLLTPSFLPLWGLQWPSKSTLATGFHLLMSHRC